MRDPSPYTPLLFDYFWLYWILKHFKIPKDIVYEIIGKLPYRNFCFINLGYKDSKIFDIKNKNDGKLEYMHFKTYVYWWETGKIR
jgi:hypothetical protein